MSTWLIGAAVLGLSAGLSPGPMLALVLSESMRHGFAAGARIAIAPLLTDGPIILLAAMPFFLLAEPARVLAWLSLAGGVYLAWLGWQSLMVADGPSATAAAPVAAALRRGVVANFLNPNPYLFWLTVGLPSLFRLYAERPATAVGFLAVFYLGLVGSKSILAWIASSLRYRVTPGLYVWVVRGLGVALLVYALIFLRQAFTELSAGFPAAGLSSLGLAL